MSRFCDILAESGDHGEGYYILLGHLTIALEAMEDESDGSNGLAAAIVETGCDDDRQEASTLFIRDGDVAGVAANAMREWIALLRGPLSDFMSDGDAVKEITSQEFFQLIADLESVGKVLDGARKMAASFGGNTNKIGRRAQARYAWLVDENQKMVSFLQGVDLEWTWDEQGNPYDES